MKRAADKQATVHFLYPMCKACLEERRVCVCIVCTQNHYSDQEESRQTCDSHEFMGQLPSPISYSRLFSKLTCCKSIVMTDATRLPSVLSFHSKLVWDRWFLLGYKEGLSAAVRGTLGH